MITVGIDTVQRHWKISDPRLYFQDEPLTFVIVSLLVWSRRRICLLLTRQYIYII